MFEISEQAFKALSKDAEERGKSVCQSCSEKPQLPVNPPRMGLYLGPNGERYLYKLD